MYRFHTNGVSWIGSRVRTCHDMFVLSPTEHGACLGPRLAPSKYDYWILHKKLVLDETITIIHILSHISSNISPRILNPHTPGYPFPLACHIYL